MDVTPHDLRNAELREAFRGYRPEEVEELLERAAVTLERMHERNRQLQEKIAGLEAEGSTAKEMESVLRQTLLLAQRTADETVTAAHDKARHLVEEAEDRALTLTSEAEEQARIVGEAQRQKFEAIVAELSARRELLTLDIDGLERVQADYRGRLRAILEKELEDLDRRATLPALAAALDNGASTLTEAAAVSLPTAEFQDAVPVFGTLRSGLGTLVDRLAALSTVDVLLGVPVRGLERRERGWRVLLGAVPVAHAPASPVPGR